MNSYEQMYKTLNDGAKMPKVGLGTWKSPKGLVQNAVYTAIKNGYRHIDCAFIYKNEDEIGNAIKTAIDENLVKRENLFITNKCWLTYLHHDRVELCLKKSLETMKLNYFDLYLIHWPMPLKQTDQDYFPQNEHGLIEFDEQISLTDTWKSFESLKQKGLVKSIGVSNFNLEQLENILNNCKIKPAVNQIECHPYLLQTKLIEFCSNNKIIVTSYCPLGSTPIVTLGHSNALNQQVKRVLNDEVVAEIAAKYNKSPAQTLIRFQLDRGLTVIPKSVTEARIIENLNVFDFKLDKADLDRLCNLNIIQRYCSFDTNGLDKHKNYPFK